MCLVNDPLKMAKFIKFSLYISFLLHLLLLLLLPCCCSFSPPPSYSPPPPPLLPSPLSPPIPLFSIFFFFPVVFSSFLSSSSSLSPQTSVTLPRTGRCQRFPSAVPRASGGSRGMRYVNYQMAGRRAARRRGVFCVRRCE